MTKQFFNPTSLSIVFMFAIAVVFSSCKGQKKVTEVTPVNEVIEEPVTEVEEKEEVKEEPRIVERKLAVEERLFNYFEAIAGAANINSVNTNINEALGLFSTPDAPVLIIIYKAGKAPDYDEPTTIGKYLHYLKDTKNNKTQVEEDSNGKIKELVLKK